MRLLCTVFVRAFIVRSFIRPRDVISRAPLDEEGIGGKAFAQTFDVLVQCVPKFDEDRSDFLILCRGQKLGTEFANLIFHTKHLRA